MARLVILAVVTLGFVAAQPVIQVKNAASPTLSNLAPGSLIRMSLIPQPGRPNGNGIDPSKPYSVTIRDATGIAQSVEIIPNRWFFSNWSLDALLPTQIAMGTATITLHFNDTEASEEVRILPVSFGLYTRQDNSVIGNIQNVSPSGEIQQNGLTTPARPGDYLTLWGTGFGVETPKSLHVVIGDRNATVVWAGKAPANPGVDQINVRLDEGTRWTEGCYIPVRVRADGVDSNTAIISIAGEGACKHPFDLTLDEMRKLDGGETIPFISVNTYRNLGPPVHPFFISTERIFTWTESAEAILYPADATSMARYAWRNQVVNSCEMTSSSLLGGVLAVVPDVLDVGGKFGFDGPGGHLELTSSSPIGFVYQKRIESPPSQPNPALLPPPFFRAGNWTLSAPGGKDILPFQLQVGIVSPLMLSNFDQVQLIDRTAALPVRWNPAGYSVDDIVSINIMSVLR